MKNKQKKEIKQLNKLVEKKFGLKNLLKLDQTPTKHDIEHAKKLCKPIEQKCNYASSGIPINCCVYGCKKRISKGCFCKEHQLRKCEPVKQSDMNEGDVFIFTNGKLKPFPIWNPNKILSAYKLQLKRKIEKLKKYNAFDERKRVVLNEVLAILN